MKIVHATSSQVCFIGQRMNNIPYISKILTHESPSNIKQFSYSIFRI